MTKRKTETRQPKTDDAQKAAREACELLGFGNDPSRLCASDRLRVDMVSTLRLVIDHAGEAVLGGGTADLSRLVGAVEHLTKLLPPARPLLPDSKLAEHQRKEKAIAPLIKFVRGLHDEIAELQRENAELRRAAGRAVPTVETAPPATAPASGGNVVPLSKPPASAAPVNGLSDLAANYQAPAEPWRGFVGGRPYDRWADNRE